MNRDVLYRNEHDDRVKLHIKWCFFWCCVFSISGRVKNLFDRDDYSFM